MEFYGWTDDTELPFLIKHRDEVLAYYGAKKGNVLRDSDYEGIIHVRGMNACMGKKFYNKYLAPLFDTKMYYEIAFTDKQSEWRKEFVQQLEERGYSVSQKYQMNSDFRVIAVKEE